MKQRAHRRRSHHGRRQPSVKRHHGRLHTHTNNKEREKGEENAGAGVGREKPPRLEPFARRKGRRPDRCDQQGLPRDQRVDEIGSPSSDRGVSAIVHHQRVRRQRQHLVEHEERREVAGERDPDRGRQAHGEARKIACLVRIVPGAHVANRIDRCDDPESGRHQRKEQAERVDAQVQGQSRHEPERFGFDGAAVENDREHGRDQHELHGGGYKGAGFTCRWAIADEADDHGGEQRDENREQRSVHHNSGSAASMTPVTIARLNSPRSSTVMPSTTTGTSIPIGTSNTRARRTCVSRTGAK